MEQRVKWISHKGKRVIYVDYTNLSSTEKKKFYEAIDQAKEFILKGGNNLLLLVDVRESFGDSEIIARLKQDGKEEKPFIAKQAVVGITGMKSILLSAVNTFTGIGMKPFDSVEQAKDWLVS